MKKYTSVWMLCARSTIWKLLGALLVMILGETGLFFHAAESGKTLSAVFSASHIPLFVFALFLAWDKALLVLGFSKASQTLYRLQISPRALLVCQTLYNALCYVIFWAAQVALLLVLFHRFGATADEALYGPQSIFLLFCENSFLHSLLPLMDWTRYIRNLCFALMLGSASAYCTLHTAAGPRFLAVALPILMLFCFPCPLHQIQLDLLGSLVALVIFGIFIWSCHSDLEAPVKTEVDLHEET